jgi:hypothetical protein
MYGAALGSGLLNRRQVAERDHYEASRDDGQSCFCISVCHFQIPCCIKHQYRCSFGRALHSTISKVEIAEPFDVSTRTITNWNLPVARLTFPSWRVVRSFSFLPGRGKSSLAYC